VFNKSTVLIIGAGASAEFNMPLGAELIKRVAEAVTATRWEDEPEKGSLFDQMEACLGSDCAVRLYQLGRELAHVAEGSKLPSMDEVLHFLSDQDVVKLGKLAIAYEIMKAERECYLSLAMSVGDKTFVKMINETWASEFLGLALSGSQRPNLSKLSANVTVIDFNYDRVLPQYLYWALQHNLGASQDAAAECVKNLKILHPYGSLGKLEWEAGKDVLPFGSRTGNLCEIASRIRTYTEESESPERVQIQDAIHGARVVIVVGFGYHKQNMQIITGPGETRNKLVFMTALGIPNDLNHQPIKDEMLRAIRCFHEAHPTLVVNSGQGMFRDLRPALSLAVS